MEALVQLFIAVFGLSALWMAMGRNDRLRKWAPLVGLAGQVSWAIFAWQTGGWGIAILVVAYTLVYLNGIRVHWFGGARAN
jgi:hypothetical protein